MFLRRFCRLIGGVAIGLFLHGLSLHAATLLPGFTETQVGSTLSPGNPTAMAFAPDGRLFVCLQGGQLRVIENGTLLATPFVTLTVDSNGDRGLLGVAFDPDFASNQFVYVYHTVPNSPAHNRVSRFTANGDVAAAGSETVILELDDVSSSLEHNGGAIHFGADGKLYIGVGENNNPANAQTVSNLLGKMLRINSDGTIPSDNPTTFPGITGSPAGINHAIWAVGLRNPYTFAFQPGTGRMFINDVGENTSEEINDGIAGSNYGWNLCEGACSPPNANYRDPLFQYGHGISSTGGCAIVGGVFYNPAINQFPASYIGKYFFSDFCSGWIRLMDPALNTANAFATGINRPVDLKVGPEGSLYYLAQGNDGQVFKVQYTPPPTPTPTPIPAQALNISTRLQVETGDKVMIGGFIVMGNIAKPLLLRGMGPSLIGSGIPANQVLLDPVLELHGPGVFIQNDNWKESPFRNLIEGTTYQPTDDREAVIVATVQPGAYTAVLTGKGQTTGVGLVEAYDINQTADSKLVNISTRGFVQTGDNVMIGGFILGGTTSNTQVAIRGIGPSLSQFGLSNLLADPTLELRDNNGTILISNDNWTDDPISAAQLTANGLALQDPHESGIFASLPPGAFTAILVGKNGGTGIGLVEIYNIP